MSANLVSFVAFAGVLTVIPGPAIVLIMKNAVLRGRSGSILTSFGVFSVIWGGPPPRSRDSPRSWWPTVPPSRPCALSAPPI